MERVVFPRVEFRVQGYGVGGGGRGDGPREVEPGGGVALGEGDGVLE